MAERDSSETYQTLYEQALRSLREIDHGFHGPRGAEQRAALVEEIGFLRRQACGRRFDD